MRPRSNSTIANSSPGAQPRAARQASPRPPKHENGANPGEPAPPCLPKTLTFVAHPGKTQENHSVSQYTIDSPQHKTNGNGKHGRPDECALAAELTKWLNDLIALEAMKKQELRNISKLRREVYAHAAKRGMSPALLRATFKLAK
jgi:hypothetical protein